MSGELYGMPIDEAWRRMGHRGQAVRVEASTLSDGIDVATRRLRIVNGDLDVELLPDRGLDVGQVRVAGIPLAWVSPTGFPRFEPAGADGVSWMRAFGGGLVTTCGLLSFGAPSIDGGAPHPLHGRYSSLAAQIVRAEVTDTEVVVTGVVREASVFGDHLELRRTLTSPIGSRSLRIDDRIVNRGSREVSPMVLYHCNLGWPLVDEGTVLRSPATSVEPRDAEAGRGLDSWELFPALAAHYPEQVFRHELPRGERVAVEVESGRGLGVRISFDTAALPAMFQWRVAETDGHVVLGVEPATAATILGRADARARGMLRPLVPGASLDLGIEIAATAAG